MLGLIAKIGPATGSGVTTVRPSGTRLTIALEFRLNGESRTLLSAFSRILGTAELGKGMSGVEGGTAAGAGAIASGTVGVFGTGAAATVLGSAGGGGFADTVLSVGRNGLDAGTLKPVTGMGGGCRLALEIDPGSGVVGRTKAVFSPGEVGEFAPTLIVVPKSAAVFPTGPGSGVPASEVPTENPSPKKSLGSWDI